ncbi:MAG: RNA polymerase sigma factor [Opitutaceae bacterium]
MTESDPELVARVLTGRDPEGFGELVRAHQSSVRRFLRTLCRDDSWADDLAQETFLLGYRRLSSFRGQSQFRTWLLGIAYNQFRNARRSRRELPAEVSERETSELGFERLTDLREDLRSALGRLSEEERSVICLWYQHGLSHGDIANATRLPLGTVKTHLARGKHRLRELLAAWNPKT